MKTAARNEYVGIFQSLEESSTIIIVTLVVIFVIVLLFALARSQLFAVEVEKEKDEIELQRLKLLEQNKKIRKEITIEVANKLNEIQDAAAKAMREKIQSTGEGITDNLDEALAKSSRPFPFGAVHAILDKELNTGAPTGMSSQRRRSIGGLGKLKRVSRPLLSSFGGASLKILEPMVRAQQLGTSNIRDLSVNMIVATEVVVSEWISNQRPTWFVEALLSRCFASYRALNDLWGDESGREIVTRLLDSSLHPEVCLDRDLRDEGFGGTALHRAAEADNFQLVQLLCRRFGARATDDKGRTALDLAAPRCKAILKAAGLLLGRYELEEGPPAHVSKRTTVVFAKDVTISDARRCNVALKFTADRSSFERQLEIEMGLVDRCMEEVQAASMFDKLPGAPVDASLPFLKFLRAHNVREGRTTEYLEEGGHRFIASSQMALWEEDKKDEDSLKGTDENERRATRRGAIRAAIRRLPYEYVDAIRDRDFIIVMDRCETTLAHMITEQNAAMRLSLQEISSRMTALAQALLSIHIMGIVHGDLKPRNVVLKKQRLLLIDFDNAGKAGQDTPTRCSSAFRSPECARAMYGARRSKSFSLHFAEDVWSFGILMWSLCTGYASVFPASPGVEDNLDVASNSLRELQEWNGLTEAHRKMFVTCRRNAQRLNMAVDGATMRGTFRGTAASTWAPTGVDAGTGRGVTSGATYSDWALDLIDWCLKPERSDRPASFDDILSHKFFAGIAGRLADERKPLLFMSHAQGSGGAQVRSLTRKLEAANPDRMTGRVWLDVDENPSLEGMKKGIEDSESVLVFLVGILYFGLSRERECEDCSNERRRNSRATPRIVSSPQTKGSLKRWFCQLEVRYALELGKPIILVNDEPSNEKGYGGHASFADYFGDAAKGDGLLIDNAKGKTSKIFDTVAIPHYSDPTFCSVTVDMILETAGIPRTVRDEAEGHLPRFEAYANVADERTVWILHGKGGPRKSVAQELKQTLGNRVPKALGKRGAVVLREMSAGQKKDRRGDSGVLLVVERKPPTHVVIFFALAEKEGEDAEDENLLNIMMPELENALELSASTSSTPRVLFLVETDERHGGLLLDAFKGRAKSWLDSRDALAFRNQNANAVEETKTWADDARMLIRTAIQGARVVPYRGQKKEFREISFRVSRFASLPFVEIRMRCEERERERERERRLTPFPILPPPPPQLLMRLLFPRIDVASEDAEQDESEGTSAGKATEEVKTEQGGQQQQQQQQQDLFARNLELEKEVAALKQSLEEAGDEGTNRQDEKAAASSSEPGTEQKTSDKGKAKKKESAKGSPSRAELDRNKRVFRIKIRELWLSKGERGGNTTRTNPLSSNLSALPSPSPGSLEAEIDDLQEVIERLKRRHKKEIEDLTLAYEMEMVD